MCVCVCLRMVCACVYKFPRRLELSPLPGREPSGRGASLQEKCMLLNTELSASPFSLVLTLAFYQNSPPMLNDSIYMYIL